MTERRKSQAVLEMGLFGSILLAIVVTFLSYQQTINDKQFLMMKTFRDALRIVQHNYAIDPSTGRTYSKGANVMLNEIEHRRHATGDFFGKGTRSVFSDSAHVYWGTPAIDAYDSKDKDGNPIVKIRVYSLDTIQRYRINGTDYDTNGKLKMAYNENSTQSHRLTENSSVIRNDYDLNLRDRIDISFNDAPAGSQYLVCKNGVYSYEAGSPQTVHRHSTWVSHKYKRQR